MKRGRARYEGASSNRRNIVLRAILGAALDGAEKGVLFSIEAHVCFKDRETGWCWPSVATIAKGAGISERTAHRALRVLETLSWIEKERQFNEHGQTSSRYRVTPPPVAVET